MQWHGAEGKRLLKASPSGFLSRRIPVLSIIEIGYYTLGRGGAVGADRELPAHPRLPALTVQLGYKNREPPWVAGMRMVGRQWRHVDRDATRNGIPANAYCRGGVFATRRFPRPLSPCSATVFVATWRAAARVL